jgi:hypothetical protein
LSEGLQSGLGRHIAIECDSPHLNHPGPVGSGSKKKPIASLGLTSRLESDFGNFQQLQSQVIQRCWVTALELKLDFADWLGGTAIGATDLTLVNGDRDLGDWSWIEFDRFSCNRRREDRAQILFVDGVG